MRMRKLSAVLLVVCLCMCSSLTVFAAEPEENEVISIDQYETAIKEEGAKYGIECKVLDYNPDIQLTKKMLENAINDIKIRAESFEIEQISTSVKGDGISINSMPVRKDVSNTFTIHDDVYGQATILVEANVTVNAQNGDVMSVNSTDAYQTGPFMNFVSWTTTKITKQINQPANGYIRLTVYGRCVFSYADPWTGVTTGYTHTAPVSVTICCD